MNKETSLSASQEDYLEMIVRLIRAKGAARVRDIASRLSVAKSSVSIALRSLSKQGLVHYKPYELVALTEKGEVLADRILARHRALSAFLIHVLDVNAEEAEANACRLEHAVGDDVMARLSGFADFMATSEVPARTLPQAFREHWAKQASADGNRTAAESKLSSDGTDGLDAKRGAVCALADVAPGEIARIVKVGGSAAGRLLDMGVTRGAKVKVIRVAPLGDPIEVDIRGYRLSLRKAEAQAIDVEKEHHV